ncbi:hypothetical protein RHSIM_Rhsim02G0064100 [Rhododendron simsii]|uniref:Protein kinase domain-containing protein n=1 Tax=Rhododendron simsii TaxID=118357 RepID=A0A834HG57_RHOSS|nr:hypothetical protein RHSIM_Rhsim02G0064100 [Rhododendron simsii]
MEMKTLCNGNSVATIAAAASSKLTYGEDSGGNEIILTMRLAARLVEEEIVVGNRGELAVVVGWKEVKVLSASLAVRSPLSGAADSVCFLQYSCGASYAFVIYSSVLKSSQGYDQSTLDTVSVFNDFGANVGVLSGVLNSAAAVPASPSSRGWSSRNFEEGQINQPVSLAVNVSSGTYSSHGNNLSRNGTKVSDVLPSSDVVSAGASSKQLPFSNNQNPIDVDVIESEGTCRSFSLDEVLIATNNFDDALVIGIGGFGKVYKGFIDDSATIVAIKRLNAESKQGAGEFWMEVKMLSKLRHANIVALIGYCNECQR